MMPQWDKNRGSEISTNSWYPHWDIYAIKLLRRVGNTSALLRWLNLVQDCYRRLGYCPEFVSLKEEELHAEKRWMHHGSPWNLNCATAWYKTLVEGIVGIEADIGGLTYIPCPLPFPVKLEGLHFRNTVWDIKTVGMGGEVEKFIVDGINLKGTYKIPKPFYRKGYHTLEVQYREQPSEIPVIREIISGEILRVDIAERKLSVAINGWGTLNIIFSALARVKMLFNGIPLQYDWDEVAHIGKAELFASGKHTIEFEY